jgi:hypothetical protein
MAVQVAELIFNDAPSKHNKELTDFLKRNIRPIVMKGQLRFRFKIAQTKDLRGLRKRGINRLPAMLLKDKPFIGVQTIVQELHNRVKNSSNAAAPKSEEEVLQDYFANELGGKIGDDGKHIVPDDDEYGDEDGGQDRMGRMSAEMERRNLSTKGLDPDDKPQSSRNKASRQAPAKPSNKFSMDDDYTDKAPPSTPAKLPPRGDNLEAGDAIGALGRMRPARDPRDDEMMRQLLEKMGDDPL